jgi:hypothetical protein
MLPHWLLFTQYLPSEIEASLVHELFAFAPVQLRLLGSMHAPYRQLVLPEQVLSHAPQFLLSVFSFTHLPLHAVCPAGQAQVPFVHCAPLAQALPHVPQLLVLESTSTQALFAPHAACPVAQRQPPIQQL